MVVTAGTYSGQVVKSGADMLGCWCYQYLSCKNNRCLVVISAYQVCKQQIKTTNTINKIRSMTATAQQTQMLEIQERYIKPRIAFIADLDTFIQQV